MRTGWNQQLFCNTADYSALASFTSEASLLGGSNEQPVFPALYFDGLQGTGKAVHVEAAGVVSSTGTPTYIFQARLGTAAGSSSLAGASVGVSVAITTGSGITNKMWRLILDIICTAPGLGTANMTLQCSGKVESDGFASPFIYPLEVGTPDTATWTQTRDASVQMYLNLSATCSASDASNTIRCKKLIVLGWD